MINLLPAEQKKAVQYARHNVSLFQYCVLVIVSSITLSAMLFFGITIMSNDQSEIETIIATDQVKLQELEIINSEAKALASTIDTISNVLVREVRFSEVISEIGSILPDGANLTSLSLSEDLNGPLAMEVIADTPDLVGVLQENLVLSELFEGADILSVTSVTGAEGGAATSYTGSLNAFFTPTTVIEPTEEEVLESDPSPIDLGEVQ